MLALRHLQRAAALRPALCRGVQVSGTNIRQGMMLELDGGELFQVVKARRTQPGKGHSIMQVEMKHIKTGVRRPATFRATERVESVRLDPAVGAQFLFRDGDNLTLMDTVTFEQEEVAAEAVGDAAEFLTEGMVLNVERYQGEIINVSVPTVLECAVVETHEDYSGGADNTVRMRTVVLENGVRLRAPEFVKKGDVINVQVEEREYISRV